MAASPGSSIERGDKCFEVIALLVAAERRVEVALLGQSLVDGARLPQLDSLAEASRRRPETSLSSYDQRRSVASGI